MTDLAPVLPRFRHRGFLLRRPLVLAAIALLSLLTMLAWLRFMGRPWVCECGTIAIWDGDPHSPGASQQFADWYSFLHVALGMGLYAALSRLRPHWPLSWTLLLAIGSSAIWEMVENTSFVVAMFDGAAGAPSYSGDSVLNAFGDTVFVTLGFVFARAVPRWVSLLALAAIEASIAFAIQDGFILGTLRVFGVSV
ncbi:DUF2585 family protein [Aureimonas jatrophae]|uniref:DUF2585 family protein n=1 Tax=Aureimonas jatrophae TaxID=1166073 RepID=A0A1H0DPT0_9HYPH|nr:DUF2585 family protein [Aureimonas jatrophae]MBB3952008.1 hypothetical protein [Aureimonas jatrophae]SDN72043.1 Protein of unknown function [Aureimonas jatrophae]